MGTVDIFWRMHSLTFLKTVCVLTCTCPKGIWLSFVLRDAMLSEGGIRVRMLEEGMMTYKVCEKTFKVGNHEIRLTIKVYRNGRLFWQHC